MPGDRYSSTRPAPVEVYLVRHGQTQWNEQRRLQGQLDSPLTPAGVNQAKQVGRRLARLNISRLVGSDLGRTRQTAKEIAEHLAVGSYESFPSLRERHLGVLQGTCTPEHSPQQAEQFEASRFGDPHYAPPQGESRVALSDRGVAALRGLAESASSGSRIAVVSHGGLIGAVLGSLLGIPATARRPFYVANCALHHLIWRDGTFEVVTLGERRHLMEGE